MEATELVHKWQYGNRNGEKSKELRELYAVYGIEGEEEKTAWYKSQRVKDDTSFLT